MSAATASVRIASMLEPGAKGLAYLMLIKKSRVPEL